MAVGTAYLALAYFGLDDVDGVTCVYHVGHVLAFAVDVVELEDAVVCGTAVGAFAVDALVAVHECFVAITLLLILDYACLW